MATNIDPIEHIIYNYGTVEVGKDEDFRTRRVVLLFKPFPYFDRMPVVFEPVYGDNLKDATENLIREIQAALCHA